MLHYKRYTLLLLVVFSTHMMADTIPERKGFFKKLTQGAVRFVESFSDVDTNYVEPQHYNYTVMLQNTNTYEGYRLRNHKGQSVTLAPQPSIKIGPFVGYRWFFLGYTFDLKHYDKNKDRQEIDLSLYSSRLTVDLFYRKTGNLYTIRSLYIDDKIDTKPLEKQPFSGFKSSIKGFNLYYIFNHRKFSYPAAFSQSTVQRRSYGSPMVGIGYTKHKMSIDLSELNHLVTSVLKPGEEGKTKEETRLTFGNYHYSDISVSGGYAYNWVFAHNWLFASSLCLGLAYKHSVGDVLKEQTTTHDYNLKNFNVNAVGRLGVVWNNTLYYVGSSAIFHAYNYQKGQFSTSTIFGNFNIYVGVNFGKRKQK